MHFKIAIVLCSLLIAVTGCISQTPHQHPTQNGPVMGTKTPTAAIKSELEQQDVFWEQYEVKDDWILNGARPESYYLTCGPTAKCDGPTEHISIYTFSILA